MIEVYKDGKVCISILHPPGHDAMSGELPEERWLPTQTVSTIILSVLSILGDPNLSSPANVDASVCELHMYVYSFLRFVGETTGRNSFNLPKSSLRKPMQECLKISKYLTQNPMQQKGMLLFRKGNKK